MLADYERTETFIAQMPKLWNMLGLSTTPKFHNLLDHVLEQMKDLNGFGDKLEDNVECLHHWQQRFVLME